MRTPLIAGNWKMNTTTTEARVLASDLRGPLDSIEGVETVVCPPFVSLATVADALRRSSVKVGAQNMHYEAKGAFTGEIAPAMLADLCEYVILGHSERRHIFLEDDALVNKKVAAALSAGLKPILAVGERLEERNAGDTEQVITRQVRAGLAGIAADEALIIAYEPAWAIGTGIAASPEAAGETIGLVRRLVAELYGDEFAQALRILYGGSVTPDNIAELMAQREVDGGLVGGASLKATDFVSIVRQSAPAAG